MKWPVCLVLMVRGVANVELNGTRCTRSAAATYFEGNYTENHYCRDTRLSGTMLEAASKGWYLFCCNAHL